MAAELGRGLFPRTVRCIGKFSDLRSAKRSSVFQRVQRISDTNRSCSRATVHGSQSDSSYESFLEERTGRKSTRQSQKPDSRQDQSYYSEWDDDDDDVAGDGFSQPWRENDRSDRGDRNPPGQLWRGGRGGPHRGRMDSKQSRKLPGRKAWRSESRSNKSGSPRRNPASRGARDRSGWGNTRQEGWSDDESGRTSFKLKEQIIGELVYGVAPVTGALKARRRQVNKLYIQEGLQPPKRKEAHAVENAISKATELGVDAEYVTKHDLNMVVGNRPHQGLAADCSPLEYVPLLELPLASSCTGERPPIWLALDEVNDPHNLGAIIRSACFLGIAGIVVSAKNSASLSPAVSKVSSGVMEFFPIHSCVKMQQFLVDAQDKGWMVVGADASPDAVSCDELKPTKPVILVVGNEGYGMRTTVRKACQVLVKIDGGVPHVNKEFGLDSLNVSVATGILLHSLTSALRQLSVKSV